MLGRDIGFGRVLHDAVADPHRQAGGGGFGGAFVKVGFDAVLQHGTVAEVIPCFAEHFLIFIRRCDLFFTHQHGEAAKAVSSEGVV